MFLNTIVPWEKFRSIMAGDYFVDKSEILRELIPSLGTEERFFCITRPRRFGKSTMVNMLSAFFGKAADSSQMFDKLAIAGFQGYKKHLNKYNVISIDFSEEPEQCTSYDAYILRILKGLKKDLSRAYPEIATDLDRSVWDILNDIFQETKETFIFLIDEWDAVFHLPYITDSDRQSYLRFLKSLLKGKTYVELAYMTGILPIAKYSGGSELNMFLEYNMATKKKFSEYFGFLDGEVDRLYGIYQNRGPAPAVSREDLRFWYDGYHTAKGQTLYNPRSVVCALKDDQLSNYWTSSGPYDEIFYYIRNNIPAVREDLAIMASGGRVKTKMSEYAATAAELTTRDQIYSAMVVYGLLTYDGTSGEVLIPNRELMDKFSQLLLSTESLGYVHRLARKSQKMLEATLAGDTQTMAEILKFAHDTESPIFSYNSEIELSAIVNLVYLAARDQYRVEREDKAGEGYVDFIFYPEQKNSDAIILELKADGTPQEAIRQIRKRNYALRFTGKLGEAPKYTGRILAVGIGYNRKTKEHSCKVEILNYGLDMAP